MKRMENRNMLLVIASACLFLVIVVGVGLWIFWPKPSGLKGTETATAQPLFDKGFDSYEFYKGRDEIPGLEEDLFGRRGVATGCDLYDVLARGEDPNQGRSASGQTIDQHVQRASFTVGILDTALQQHPKPPMMRMANIVGRGNP